MKNLIAVGIAMFAVGLIPAGRAGAQEAGAAKAARAEGATIESIHADYERDVIKLERQRLERLARLASSQPKDQAAATYSTLFSLAISRGLYAEAEPAAEGVIHSKDAATSVVWLAHLINIVAEADRGAYEDSLASLSAALRLSGQIAKDPKDATGPAALSIGTRASIVDAYYQRLVRDDQFDVARKAMRMIAEKSLVPAIRELAQGRLKQLDLVGRPAPAIAGIDLDRKPFTLEAGKGDVVLVVFWASWCVPNAQEIPWLEAARRRYGDRGFRIVGVNLDATPEHGQETVMPNVRRFVLDYNVPWTTLINGQGNQDLARAFGVQEIPANVLIGRDGKVSHLDLTGPRLERAIAKAVAVAAPR